MLSPAALAAPRGAPGLHPDVLRWRVPTQQAQEIVPPVRHGDTVFGSLDAILEMPEGDIRQARAEQCRRVIPLKGERLLGVAVGFLWPPAGQQPQCREHVREGRERIGLLSPLEERLGLVGLLVQTEAHPQQAKGRNVGRLELDRPSNSGLQVLPSSFDESDEGLAVEAIRRLSLQLQRRRERLSGARAGLVRGDQAHVRREREAFREPGPRGRMSRIEVDGFLEGANGPAMVLLGVPKMLSQQVAPIGFEVTGLRSGREGPRTRSEPGLDGLNDTSGDLVLHGEDVLQLPVEALGPELVAACHVCQLGGSMQAAASRPHATLEHMANGEQPGDLLQAVALLPGAEGGCARCDADAFDPNEGVHDLLGHAFEKESWILVDSMSVKGSTAMATAVCCAPPTRASASATPSTTCSTTAASRIQSPRVGPNSSRYPA